MAAKNSVETPLSPVEARVALAILKRDYTASAFVYAAERGDLVVVKLFVDAGMSVDTADHMGFSALHFAARSGHLEVVEYLVSQGADVTVRDRSGQSARDLAERVIEGRKEINSLRGRGRTAEELAEEKGLVAVVDYLKSVGG